MLSQPAIDRLCSALRLDLPLLALYHAEPGPEFEPLIYARGRACCFSYFERWREGKTLVVELQNDAGTPLGEIGKLPLGASLAANPTTKPAAE